MKPVPSLQGFFYFFPFSLGSYQLVWHQPFYLSSKENSLGLNHVCCFPLFSVCICLSSHEMVKQMPHYTAILMRLAGGKEVAGGEGQRGDRGREVLPPFHIKMFWSWYPNCIHLFNCPIPPNELS
jgi:hypothetical protein